MMRPLLVIVVLGLASTAHAAPRVAVIDTERLWDAGGIARWATARAQLDAERKKFKVVEKPKDAPSSFVPATCNKPQKDMEKFCQRWREIERKQVEDGEWTKREREVLDPIEADVHKELARYAIANGIELVIDRSALDEDALLFVAPQANVTDAFIKSYNAKKKK